MNVLFVAALNSISASGRQRLWALQQCGMDVTVINKDEFPSVFGKWAGRAAKLLKQPRLSSDTKLLESVLTKTALEIRPELIWMEWPKEFQPATLQYIKKQLPNSILISFQDDNPWGERTSDQWMWKDYFTCVPFFDWHIVKRTSDVTHLTALGAKKMTLWEHGMYSPVFYPDASAEKKYPVSFVGTCMDQRVEFVEYLLEKGVPIHVFGNRWDSRSTLPKRFPHYFHKAVVGDAYADVIRQSNVCLGLVSHSNQDEWTMRSYEVPACAVLLLAERTPVHENLFEEDVTGIFFSNKEECANKLLALVQDENKCRKMGLASYDSFVKKKYSLVNRMKHLLNEGISIAKL